MIASIFFVFLYVLCLAYGIFLIAITIGLRKKYPKISDYSPMVSILVPARNEEKRIGKCLDSILLQDYPKEKMEIIVIDDASTDATAEIAGAKTLNGMAVKIIRQKEKERGKAPKKQAIQRGIEESKGEIVFTIDADCVAEPHWVSSMLKYFGKDTGVVFGWVGIASEQDFFHKIQSLEYISWVGVAVGFAGLGAPTMCNANNLAYRKKAYHEVNGFEGIDHIQSGDDELLMQKIKDQTHWRVSFCSQSINYTAPCNTVHSFINQRIRWASKGFVYKRIWLQALLFLLFLYYLSFPALFAGSFFFPQLWIHLGIFLLLKSIFDFPVALWSAGRTGKKYLLKYFIFTELFNLVYVPIVSTAGTFGLFKWKPDKQRP